MPFYTAVLTWEESSTRHNLDVAQNTTFKEVSSKVNEYLLSENTLYKCIAGFNNDRISISHNKQYVRQVSAVKK